jgi:hypothetical protein
MIEPIHVATLAGQPLRFFRTPLDDGRPDLPWHCVDDLHQCLGIDRAARRVLLSKMRVTESMQTVATPDGIVTVAPHYMALGSIDAMINMGRAPASLRAEYALAGTEACQKIAPPGFPNDPWRAWMKAAWNRHEGQ